MPKKPQLPPINLESNETIGERIARLRREKKQTQQQLADIIGIERYLIADYEQGRARIYDEMLKRIAIALEVSSDYLLGLTGKEKNKDEI